MNVRLGISRIFAVFWGLVGLWGIAAIVISITEGAFDPVVSGIGISVVLFSYVGWKVSIWVLNGFFSRNS